MNKASLSIVVTVSLLVGAGVAIHTVRVNHQRQQAAAALASAEERAQRLERFKADALDLEQQRQALSREVDDLRHELAAARSGAPSTQPEAAEQTPPRGETTNPKAGPLGGMMAKMLEDPEMRQFIRSQQRQMMDSLYEPLIQRLGLTPEEGEVFKDYLADTQMSAANQAGALFGGSATNRADAMATILAEQKRADETLKAFLGEEGYAQYKDHQETLGERMQLNQFKMQAGNSFAMTDEQTEWLLGLIREEKRAVAANTGQAFPGAGQDPASMQTMFSGEGADQILKMQETVNQRVYERAREGLDPNQLAALGRLQTNQLQTLRMGMSMMRMITAPAAEGANAAH